MGIYLNPNTESFEAALNSQIYVDKTGLIAETNKLIGTEQKWLCISRPRRFGKSMAAKMLAAYYGKNENAGQLFEGLRISKDESYKKHLNQYDVLHLDMQWFRSNTSDGADSLMLFQKEVIQELKDSFPECIQDDVTALPLALAKINNITGKGFVIIIDEWDCLFREEKYDTNVQKEYVLLLRGLFKGAQSERFVKLAYLTGILPIKKYGTESALNNFNEYTMINPSVLAEYVGFTEEEVKALCDEYHMDFSETKRWYDGYSFKRIAHIYSPRSVVEAMRREEFDTYWTTTETYESLKGYIKRNFDGLKDDVIIMLGGGRCRINPRSFQNDMTSFQNKDDVLTLLVHLGYLAFDEVKKEVYIPNLEVRTEFADAVEGAGWNEVTKAIRTSDELLEATLHMDADTVAKAIDDVHMDTTSILNYNNENALSCVISLAYFCARDYFTIVREMPSGKGFADMVFIPYRNVDKPAMIIELKWDSSAEGAIDQIRKKEYVRSLAEYKGDILLVGINYDKESKKHQCVIEKMGGLE